VYRLKGEELEDIRLSCDPVDAAVDAVATRDENGAALYRLYGNLAHELCRLDIGDVLHDESVGTSSSSSDVAVIDRDVAVAVNILLLRPLPLTRQLPAVEEAQARAPA
jgi:hypothetical protein